MLGFILSRASPISLSSVQRFMHPCRGCSGQWAQNALWLPCDILLENSAASGAACSEQLPKAQSPASKSAKWVVTAQQKGLLISQVKTKVMFEEKCQSNTQLNPYCFRKCQIHLWKTSHSSRSHRACNRGFCSNSTKRCLIGILWITSSLICRWHTILVLMKVWWSRTLKKKHSN